MQIAILALGTRGDVELFAALGQALQQRGHDVVLGSSPFFESLIREAGLGWQTIGDGHFEDLRSILRSLGETSGGVARTQRYAAEWLGPQLREGGAALRRMTSRADYFISNLKLVMARNDEVIPGAAVTYDPPASPTELERSGTHLHADRILDLVAMDRSFIGPQSQWEARYHFTGFWDAAPTSAPNLEPGLEAWLGAAEPPVVVSLGSMMSVDPADLFAGLRAAARIGGHRFVVVGGWSTPPAGSSNDAALHIVGEAPYSRLFPAARCIVHHGGYGTVVAALKAGVPSVVLPQIRAQEVFGRLLLDAHLATDVLDSQEIDARRLVTAIDRATHDDAVQAQIRAWRSKLTGSDGLGRAADAIEAHATGVVSTNR